MPPRPLQIVPFAVLAVSVCLMGVARLDPLPGRPIAAVFPPWWSAARTFSAGAQSGAQIARLGAFSNILVVTSATNPAQRLRAAGALLLLDAQSLGCGAKL
jgi:hypothetical protein